jgi:hypothetical protein
MKLKTYKKQLMLRKGLEKILLSNIQLLASKGILFDTEIEKSPSSNKFNIYKKHYLKILDEAEESIKNIKNIIISMEDIKSKELKKAKFDVE